MREASLHLTERSLSIILTKMLPFGTNVLEFTRALMKQAKPYSIPNRAIVTSTDKIEKKADKLCMASNEDAHLMARMIFLVRKQLKHKGVTQITTGQRDWDLVKQITKQANDFTFDFEFATKREGYIEYIKVGCTKMQHFSTRKFLSMYSAICDHYAAQKEIEDDPNQGITITVHEQYRNRVAMKTGAMNNFKDNPIKYVGFVRASVIIKKFGVNVNQFLSSQFDSMDKFDACPDPLQLGGDKAKERLNKWLYENNIDVRKNGNGKH